MTPLDASLDPTPWWRPLARSDRRALVGLLALATALFVIPALFGRPAIDADNLIQNFPLRVLVGRQIASGHLPLLNPLANAGTPLLGGMNAGAFYPLTILFAFVPALAAWIINMVAVYVTASFGLFALARWHGLTTLPAVVAAITYAYSGALVGQMVHLGVVQGYSFLPWIVLVLLALSRRLSLVRPEATWREWVLVAWPWSWAVALLWALTFLSGEPRAIADSELLTIVVVPAVLLLSSSYRLRYPRARVAYLVALAGGFAIGLGLGLAQLLPAWSFIRFSQRSTVTYPYFGAGSLPVHWTALLFAPDLFGGNGAFGQSGYFANYNLAEVTGYVGIVALVAAAAFVTRLVTRSGRREERDFVIYCVVAVVGLLATWGEFTPAGHIFRAIPLFGSTRLQSRNVILVDLALSLALGWWLERLRTGSRRRAGLGRGARWFTVAPAVFTALLSLALVLRGPWVIARVGITDAMGRMENSLTFLNLLHLVIAAVAVALIIVLARGGRSTRALVTLIALDLALFVTFTATGLIGGNGPRSPAPNSAVAQLGATGRFALVDPTGAHTEVFRAIGQPNLNVFTGLESVQGYGALISTIYDDVTGTHPQSMLDPCHLAEGTFTQLRLASLAIGANELSAPPNGSGSASRCVRTEAAPAARRYFGQVLNVGAVTVTAPPGHVVASGSVHVRLIDGAGGVDPTEVGAPPGRSVTVRFAHDPRAAGFVVTSPRGVDVRDSAVETGGSAPRRYALNTTFQWALDTSAWRLTSTVGTYSVFRATSVRRAMWLVPAASSGSVRDIRNASWGDAWATVVTSRGSWLDRSEAYLPGWRATARNVTTGRVLTLSVLRAGLIERVYVPPGKWRVHFHYHAPYIDAGLLVSGASFVLFAGAGAGLLRRRRRDDKVRA